MVMRTSTEIHTYFSDDETKVAKVFEAYEGWFVEFYKDNVLVERRDLYEHNEQYAEDAAENWVLGVIKG